MQQVLDPPLIQFARAGNSPAVETALAMYPFGVNDRSPGYSGSTALYAATQHRHPHTVQVLLAANADPNIPTNFGKSPLYLASLNGSVEIVKYLLAANADVDQALPENGATPLVAACQQSQHHRTDVVAELLAANASTAVTVDEWGRPGFTPLIHACRNFANEIVAKLLDADADVDQADANGVTPLHYATGFTRAGIDLREALHCVQLVSSYGAARISANVSGDPITPPAPLTPEQLAAALGLGNMASWFATSLHWSPLHHLEVLTPARAFALLRAGAGANAAAGASGPTPLDRAKELCSSGRADAGSAAHVVLAWGAPWSRQTHKHYPPKVRARAAELVVLAQRIKRGDAFRRPGSVADAWESLMIPCVLKMEYLELE